LTRAGPQRVKRRSCVASHLLRVRLIERAQCLNDCAPLGIAFYEGAQFPPDYRGDAFVTLHGSWNRAKRTGYKVVRLRLSEAKPTGEYEDFLTGFVVSDQAVWGRPVGVAVAHDGALLVSEDGNRTIWRVSYHEGNR
jgi:glucose/arabinose dehydrogenase